MNIHEFPYANNLRSMSAAPLLLAFDLGTSSVGWAAFDIDTAGTPIRLLDAGVRLFGDGREPKSRLPLAVGRRIARGMSRRRDRYKRRRKALLRTLIEFGLMPEHRPAQLALIAETRDSALPSDVYALRARALDEALSLYQIGRIFFHLNQRRGFKSNRRTDSRDNEQGMIAQGIARLHQELLAHDARTLGELLFKRRGTDPKNRGTVRVRAQTINVEGKDEQGYGFYPERSFLQHEFNAIWDAQAKFYPDLLTEERRAHLHTVIFYQRPLKPAKPGKCSFFPDEDRLPKAHPLFQEFRLFKEVNELKLKPDFGDAYPLTLEQRDLLITVLRPAHSSKYTALRKKLLKASQGIKFNKESESRLSMKGDEVYATMSDKSRFGALWSGFSVKEQTQLVEKLYQEDDPLALDTWLANRYPLLEASQRDAISGANLPEGFGRLGVSALETLLVELKADVITEYEAIQRAGLKNAEVHDGHALLPPYQEVLAKRIPAGTGDDDDPYDIRMGRITNPTVHIALNQLRRVVNLLIQRFGKPEKIAIELARDLKLSEEQKKQVNHTIAKNTRANELRSDKLRDLERKGTYFNIDNGYNRYLLKLWEELDPAQPLNRRCIYSGKPISIEMLFNGEVDVDHILPYSQTLDDSQANKLLCLRDANRIKKNRPPSEVAEWVHEYDGILDRASRLPASKRWRFAPGAMKRFREEEGFLARQLTDTQYLSRLAHEYLAALYPDEEPDQWGVFVKKNHVRINPGRMTQMLRHHWGLNELIGKADAKNRNDHRHHAIDAAVIGAITPAMLNRVSRAAASREAQQLEKSIGDIDLPFPTFREELERIVSRIVVSHKPDHGTLPSTESASSTAGRLHNDTAYGLTGETDAKGVPIVVRRKSFLNLQRKDIATIRDEELQAAILKATDSVSDKDFPAALDHFRKQGPKQFRGIRRVRVIETLNVIPIRDEHGRAYKAYKGDANYRYDVWELPSGKWVEELVSMFEAHKLGWQSEIHKNNPAARRVLSLHKDDMVAYRNHDNEYTVGRVVKFSKGSICFASNREGGALKARDADKTDPFKYFIKSASSLKDAQARQIRVDETGRVFDPGPQDRQSRAIRKQNGNINNKTEISFS
ncbi:type II CRISPR RNA-guided endonuclease Cas9 [Limoniibacter endophyticus]|uniref:CRISPR-associated endonuclease Cas9 n=1 Tax=Limoniibacter endophyticus TaxID=1565040 RepID=A0A8J3GGK1_9HYPH|nr:type II CRISPR RNA-guided endonuclease Cas9 [Limoniibacter endophyticus]GHC73651.1 CRISPR-associated endonuclease Cas9 [Limoniibacter endophyticus]